MSGSHEIRRVRRAAAPQLDVRATTVKPKFSQPTNVIALTSTFSGPTSCYENSLSMLPPASFIWLNEPVPVPNNTVAACYPSEFLESYTSVAITNPAGSVIPSSIVPAMSPFACPKNWCTMLAQSRNYIACCPSDYLFHPPDTTVDPNRPAYGGTCYSDLPAKTTVPVVKYDEDGNIASGAFSTSASGAQAFAHPIDGWALTSPTIIGCATASTSLTSSDTAPTPSDQSPSSTQSTSSSSSSSQSGAVTTPSPTPSNSTSTGAIVGATIGSCIALASLIALVVFLLRRRRANTPANGIPKDAHQVDDDFGGPKTYYRSEASASYPADYHSNQMMPAAGYAHEKAAYDTSERGVNGGMGAFEMQAVSAMELPAEEAGKGGKLGILGR